MIDLHHGTRALAAAILHFSWQGCLLAAVAAGIGQLVRGVRARYAVELSGLLAMPLVFLATVARHGSASIGGWQGGGGISPPEPWRGWLVIAWGVGVAGFSLRIGAGFVALSRLRRGVRGLEPHWQERVRALAIAMRATIRTRVVESILVTVPMAIGWFSPLVVLPAGLAARLPRAQIEAIVLHELAHIRRFDVLVGWIQAGIEALLFFHPALWWLSRRVRWVREACCDDLVCAELGDPMLYARTLVEVESQRALLGAAALHDGSSLRARIERIMGIGHPRASWPAVALLLLLAFGLGAPATWSASSVVTARFPEEVARWAPLLETAGRKHGVDPNLLAAMTWAESRGDPSAQSSAGARGLLQVMPATANQIARERDLPEPHPEQLDEPAYNVDVAAWYLAQQLATFDREPSFEARLELAIAAYNAGPDRVLDYLERGEPLPEETRAYRTLVTSLYAATDPR